MCLGFEGTYTAIFASNFFTYKIVHNFIPAAMLPVTCNYRQNCLALIPVGNLMSAP